MAKRNYLVEGLSGAGKSSVYEELIRRGYTAISADRAWAYHADPDTGRPGGPIRHDTFMWDEQKAVDELESPEPEVLFVCGSSREAGRSHRRRRDSPSPRAGRRIAPPSAGRQAGSNFALKTVV
jgi:hypothetical protein